MEIIHEKSYEDMQISLLMVRNEKSCPRELIWGHEKPNFARECMRAHMEIFHGKSYEDMRISLLMVHNEKSCPRELIWVHEKPNFSREGMRAHVEIIHEKSTSYMSYLWAPNNRIQWVFIAGELIWGYEKGIIHYRVWELIWKSCMRNHMKTCKLLYSCYPMRNHAQENSFEDTKKPWKGIC